MFMLVDSILGRYSIDIDLEDFSLIFMSFFFLVNYRNPRICRIFNNLQDQPTIVNFKS